MSTVIVVTEWQTGGMCRSKERFRFWAGGSMVVWNSNYTPQNYLQFKMYELHISGVFQLIFLGNNWGLTEHTEGDIWDQRGWPCLMIAFRWKKTREGATWSQKWLQMAHLFPCEEAQAPLQPGKKTTVSKSRDEDNDDAEVIFVGVDHVSEDAETLYVGVTSTSKPVISNVFNRVTRDSSSRRMKDHVGPDPSCMLQPANVRTPASEPAAISPASQCVWWGRGNSIISEPSSKPDYKTSSLETVLHNSELLFLRPPCLSGAVLSLGGKDESPLNSKWCPTSDVNFNSGNPKDPNSAMESQGDLPPPWPLQVSLLEKHDYDLGRFPDLTEPCSWWDILFTDSRQWPGCFRLMDPEGTWSLSWLEKMDFLTLARQSKTVDAMKVNLGSNLLMKVNVIWLLLLWQHTRDGTRTEDSHSL